MKFYLTKLYFFTIVFMINFSCFAMDTDAIKVKSIPAASFKPLYGAQVTEFNGCYSNVSYIGFNLPIGSALIRAKITVIDTVGTELVGLRVVTSYAAMIGSVLSDSMIDLKPLNVIKYIPATPAYIVKENDFFSIHFTKNKSNTVRLCGVKIYYLTDPASELIFYNGFE